MNRLILLIAGILLFLALASSSIFVVDQRQYAVVYSFKQIARVQDVPGLYFKWPAPFENVVYEDKRLLTLSSEGVEPMLTSEKQRVVIDWYVRWKITHPKEYIRLALSNPEREKQIRGVIRDAFQEQINKRTFQELLSLQRNALMADVKKQVIAKVQDKNNPWGVDIVDVRITRVDYVQAITDSVYKRMQAERKRVANELRSTGSAVGEQIRADADRQREVIVANAYRDAQKVMGEGDAQAAQIYAEAFGRDPEFARFYRSLTAYKDSLNSKSDVMVLDPASNEFFKVLRNGGAGGAAPSKK